MHESGCRNAQVAPRGNGAGRPATRQAMNGLFRIISLPVHSFGVDFEGAMQNSIEQITAIMDIEGASGSKMYIGLEVEMHQRISDPIRQQTIALTVSTHRTVLCILLTQEL